MECEKCSSTDLECIKQEVKFFRSLYYEEPDEVWIVHFKCNGCGYEFEESI